MGFPIKKLNLYKIGLYEIIILFIVLFFTYTMPLTVYKFTSSFLGKFISLLSIIYACYYNISYGVVLAIIFLSVSEVGYRENFYTENFENPPVLLDSAIRYITFHQGTSEYLQISQVAVYTAADPNTNIAPRGTATAPNVYNSAFGSNYSISEAIDGKLEARPMRWDYVMGGYISSHPPNPSNYWKLDLGQSVELSKIVYYNRYENGTGANWVNQRSIGTFYTLENNSGQVVWTSPTITSSDYVQSWSFKQTKAVTIYVNSPVKLDARARYVTFHQGTSEYLQISQLAVYTSDDPTTNIATKGTVSVANQFSPDFPAKAAIDGQLMARPSYLGIYASHWTGGSNNYWQLDLGQEYNLSKIVYYNRNEVNSGFDWVNQLSIGTFFTLENNSGQLVWTSPTITTADQVQKWIFVPRSLTAKEAFIKEHCSANKTTFRLDTIDKDYPSLEFTEGACEPCNPTCRYNISNSAESLYYFDQKIKPKEVAYVENFEGSIHSDLKNINNKKNKLNASMLTEGLTSNIVDKAKVAFLKTNCSANKTKFRLDTIDKDYPGLEFTEGVCEPCDPTCRYIISNPAETLYDFDRKIKPTDSIYIENFESAILSDLKGKYKKNKRKAAMIKDGFTSKVVDKVTHYARKYNL